MHVTDEKVLKETKTELKTCSKDFPVYLRAILKLYKNVTE